MSAEDGPELGDAFGQMLREYQDAGQQSGMVFEVIERSDGLISVGDAARYFAGLDDWPEHEKTVLGRCPVPCWMSAVVRDGTRRC